MKRLIINVLFLCIALLCFSCAKEEPEARTQNGEPCAVTFRLETESAAGIVPVGFPATRISRPIQDLSFFVYNDGGLVRFGQMTSPMIPTMKLVPGTYRIYAVANTGGTLGQMGEAELLALCTPVTGHDDFIKNGAMCLSGMQTLTVSGPTSCRLVLRRAAAKIHMAVRFGKQMENARIVHVVPCNAPACGRPFEGNRLAASDPQLEFPCNDFTDVNLQEYDFTYYQYENLAGMNPRITDSRERTDELAPELASYVSIRVLKSGVFYDYKVYLGGNATTDFNVRRNTVYNYDVTIVGTNPDDLRVSTTEIVFWAGRDYSIGGQRYQDGFSWNARTAYAELELITDNCASDQEYTVSFRPLSGTFHDDWTMEYMISSLPTAQREYRPITPGQRVTVHKGNGASKIVFAFSNLEGTRNFNTTDNYFEFTVCDSRGWGRMVVLSTNMDEWFK